MLDVSNALKRYYNTPVRAPGQIIEIKVTSTAGVTKTLTESDISNGSVELTRKAISSGINIGEAYLSALNFTIQKTMLPSTLNLVNAIVECKVGVNNTEIDETVTIFKGIILADDVVSTLTLYQITAYSFLSKLDKNMGTTSLSGTPYDLVTYACVQCGLENSQMEEDYRALNANHTAALNIPTDGSISTFRDLIMFVSQIMCCVATDTADGKLKLIKIESQGIYSPDFYEVNSDLIKTSKYSQGELKLDGLVWSKAGKQDYIYGGIGSEYTLSLQNNPLCDNMTDLDYNRVAYNLWEDLKDNVYNKIDIQYNGNPIIELGDIIKVNNSISAVTSIKYKYKGNSSIICESLTKSKATNKVTSSAPSAGGGSGTGGGDTLGFVRVINGKEYKSKNAYDTILEAYVSVDANTAMLAMVTIPVEVLADNTLLTAVILYDNVQLNIEYKYTLSKGFNTLSFKRLLDGTPSKMVHHLVIKLKTTAAADIRIMPYQAELVSFGTSVSDSTPAWTGIFEVSDTVRPANLALDADYVKEPRFSESVRTTEGNA